MPYIFLYVKMGLNTLIFIFSYRSRALFGIYPTQSIHFTYLYLVYVSMATLTDLYVPVHYWTGIFIYQYSKN